MGSGEARNLEVFEASLALFRPALFLYSLAGGVVAGVAMSLVIAATIFDALFFALLAAVVSLFVRIRHIPKSAPVFFVAFLVGASLGLGDVAFQRRAPPPEFRARLGTMVNIDGVIARESIHAEQTTRVVLAVETLDGLGMNGRTRVLLFLPTWSDFSYGDKLRAVGTLVSPRSFTTDSGNIFDYPHYLEAQKIDFILENLRAERIGHGGGSVVLGSLYSLKHAALARTRELFPEPDSALLAGMILGERHGIGASLEEAFRRSGLVHILVLSGYNMALVATILLWMLGGLPPRLRYTLAITGIVLFVLMAGASAAAVRAALMALLVIGSKISYRPYHAFRALILAGLLMVLWNPLILLYDLSFQLSFLATAGLIVLSPFFESVLMRFRLPKNIQELTAATLSTQLAVAPLLAFTSGAVSLVAPVGNLFVLPVVPFVMLGGALSVIASFAGTIIAAPFAATTHILIEYIVAMSRWFASLPFAELAILSFGLWALLASYVVLVVFFMWLKWYTEKRRLAYARRRA